MNQLKRKVDKLEIEIETIKARNRRVEVDKAWETSVFKIVTITLLTYLIMCLILYSLGTDKFVFNAVVPTLGFVLSTQSLPFIKRWWIKIHNAH